MKIDGKKIAALLEGEIRSAIDACDKKLTLGIFMIAPTKETESFVRIKKKKAGELGVDVHEVLLDKNVSEEQALSEFIKLTSVCDGVVLQQPIPNNFSLKKFYEVLPVEKDIDALTEGAPYLSPVAGALDEIFSFYKISLEEKRAVVIGSGKLVGLPASALLKDGGAEVSVMTKETGINVDLLRNADIIVSGAGRPGLLTKDMVSKDSIIIDAGTSESRGAIVGDVDPECYEYAALVSPVPGGVGPITVMYLFKNLFKSASCAL
ncbi:MAG: tetrahydrofolate dehydrogenase/cyclohydrolase catalytic domain-containing protein [Patescibacteria group bacterium UBA2103]